MTEDIGGEWGGNPSNPEQVRKNESDTGPCSGWLIRIGRGWGGWIVNCYILGFVRGCRIQIEALFKLSV